MHNTFQFCSPDSPKLRRRLKGSLAGGGDRPLGEPLEAFGNEFEVGIAERLVADEAWIPKLPHCLRETCSSAWQTKAAVTVRQTRFAGSCQLDRTSELRKAHCAPLRRLFLRGNVSKRILMR
jgi:hypothetical protein